MSKIDLKLILKYLLQAISIGVIGGLFYCLYNFCAKYATMAWMAEPHALFCVLMPVVGLAIVATEKLLKTEGKGGSNNVIKESGGQDCDMPLRLALSSFITLLLTDLAETVTGREGGSWQLGAPIAKYLNNKLFPETQNRIAISCAIGVGFGTLWGLPLFGAIIGSEMAFGSLYFPALGPSLVSAYIGNGLATYIFPNETIYKMPAFDALDAFGWFKMVLLAIAVGLLGRLFTTVVDVADKGFSGIKNTYLRIFTGGAIVGILSFFSGKTYLCGVNEILTDAIAGKEIIWYAFAAKMVFFALLYKSGYKTGTMIQSLSVGALFGAVVGPILGLPSGLSAALGFMGLFESIYNTPIAAIALAFEVFEGNCFFHFVFFAIIARFVSGRNKIYTGQDLSQEKPLVVFKKED